MGKLAIIKEILNYIYANQGELLPLDGDSEKIKILHELYENGVIL